MALNFKKLQPISEIMLCITGVIFISALFFIDELFKSFRNVGIGTDIQI